MLFTFLAVLAACPTSALRPELSRAAISQKIASVGDLVSKISSPKESKAALQTASGIVSDILAETGNATEHMSDDDAALLREVIELIEDAIYGSMDSAHNADVKALNDGKDAVGQCNVDIKDRQAADGDLGQLHQHVTDKQTELDRLQGVVDDKTLANATEWNTFNNHMQMISTPPACPGLPARTMPALDVYFEKSEYSIWFAAQQAAYDAARDKYSAADSALQDAIAAYNVQLAVRDTQYCDWKEELEAACAQFDVCFQSATDAYNALVPVVTSDMNQRIENLKAGDTLIQQIKFLLADAKTRETPASDVSRYTIAFPSLPTKADCDLSVLEDSKWVPTVSCGTGSWQLAMNIHASDGHNFGYGASEWHTGAAVGSDATALTADYLNAAAWDQTTGFVAIVRHQNGECEAVKAWELTDKTRSLKQYFQNHNPGRMHVTGPEPFLEKVSSGMQGEQADPITGKKGGGLVFNWWYSNNGCRIATTKAHWSGTLSAANANDDDTHGLGNEFGANTQSGQGSSAWWHDVANLQGNSHGSSIIVQGTDHGTSLRDAPLLGQYAVYISSVKEDFPC